MWDEQEDAPSVEAEVLESFELDVVDAAVSSWNDESDGFDSSARSSSSDSRDDSDDDSADEEKSIERDRDKDEDGLTD